MSFFAELLDAGDLTVRGGRILSIVVTVAAIRLLQWLIKRQRFIEAVNLIPGPPLEDSHPFWAHLSFWFETLGTIPNYPDLPNSLDLFTNFSKQFQEEGLFRIWIFNPYRVPFARTSVTLLDPVLVHQFLTDKDITSRLVKEKRIYRIAEPVIGSSFLSLPDNAAWKHQRKLTAAAFHQHFLEHTNVVATNLLEEVFPVWDRSPVNTIEMLQWSSRMTIEVLGLVAFSYSFGGLRTLGEGNDDSESMFDTYRTMLSIISKRTRSPPLIDRLHSNWRFRKASRRLNSVVSQVVRERLQKENEKASGATAKAGDNGVVHNGNKKKDLLSYMMIPDENGNRLSYDTLFGNVRMFLFAGHDTTAATLAYALWELATHSDAQTRLQREVDCLFESMTDGENPSYKQLMQLKYLDAVVKETLRLHAPAGVVRKVESDITLRKGENRSYTIPAGMSVFIFARLTHRSKKYCPERPDDFKPERWLDDTITTKSNWYYPFSIGPRNCVGQPLATAELKIILSHIMRRYTVRPNVKADEPIPVVMLTIKPHQVLLDIEQRKNSVE